jgi:CelD/BcsL family acetyltransferase involved in cellulose biosynthesis
MPVEAAAGLRIEELHTTDALEALVPEWRALWDRSPAATPFQAPEWLLPWWRYFGGEGLRTFTLRRAGRLVGLAPCFVHTEPTTGSRQITLLGNGISDHLDLLLEPDHAPDGAALLLQHLAGDIRTWEACDFRDLPAESPLLAAPTPVGVLDEVTPEEPCPTLTLPRSADPLHAAVPAPLLRKLDYCRRRAGRLGTVTIGPAERGSLERDFEWLLRLHRSRWATRGAAGVLDDDRVVCFHRDAMRRFLARGWLRLHTLRLGEQAVAACYGFLARERAYYYLGGFAPAFARLSPGHLVLLHALEEALREGARELDFLRGREAYKYAWGARDRPQYRRRLWPA